MSTRLNCILSCLLVLLATTACQRKSELPAPVRPVRAITVKHEAAGESSVLSGQIQAQNHVNLAFRLDGRLTERTVSVGDTVTPGQLIAKLESEVAHNTLLTAQAALEAANASLTLAQKTEARQKALMDQGASARAQYDLAVQQLDSATAQVNAAQARLKSAQENLGYTELRADVQGTVTAKGAEPGEVIRAGQMIVRVAQEGGKDAVFYVPERFLRRTATDPTVKIELAADPKVTATGRVREVSPQADPGTGAYEVKVGLDNPPESIRLGATVTGSMTITTPDVIQVPASALTQTNGQPAVWVVDPSKKTVAMREVTVNRYEPASAIVTAGLSDGDIVVTAGVQALRPGQEVKLLPTVADTAS